MAIRVALNHSTKYTYDRLVTLSPHVIRLRPAPHCRTPILSYSLRVKPEPHFLNWQQDPYSNYLARVVFPKPEAIEMTVEVDLVADLTVINPFDFFIAPEAEIYPFAYDAVMAKELAPYLELEPLHPYMRDLVESLRRSDIKTIDYLVLINQRLHERIRYVIRMETGIQTCEETLEKASGSCRDSAWVLVQVLRRLGLAARFVSGYLIQLKPDVEALDGPSGALTDFTDLHAWTEVYLPGAGWIGLDPTSGLLVSEGHIPLAGAADPLSASPINGSFGWTRDPKRGDSDTCVPTLDFSMSVARIYEDPRVTKPYSDAQWGAIEALGHGIDERLRMGDVRLTMGGEPTFVSIDDMEGEEWNIGAVGEEKRRLSDILLKRLRERFAPGGMLHFGQGKWYPGESLPRWAFSCFWRKDGVPVWERADLVGDELKDYGYGPGDAEKFLRSLADRLGVNPEFAMPGYEDAFYFLWRESRLPSNVDPFESKLEDPEERARLTQVFDRGLGEIIGYVLPLEPRAKAPKPVRRPRWVSAPWDLRRKQLFLLPGESPLGLRLPLDSLKWVPKEDREPIVELDPFAPRGPLPPRQGFTNPRPQQSVSATPEPTASGDPTAALRETPVGHTIAGTVRTALCIQPRNGRLYVFMPPMKRLEDYLDLVAAIEETAVELEMPVLIEGYTPPSDHRINAFSVTPDPGVIEVNVHPSHSWDELVSITTTIYEEGRLARLGTEKFMMDGRFTGTGGGNHIILGGPTPADSPVLRRPDLLRSLIAYWHNHPSLSYLFSGMFVGPHSQAPRVDEARNDSLYEMEIAFSQIPERGECPPWLVDRVFRHLLADVTGNTHRSEFCIDKLYAPEVSGGRRGLVELRAFEMPPHPRMSLAQQLLIRGLVAWLWETPYKARLKPWGTELHDRFLLPHFVAVDFHDVIHDLRAAGFGFEAEWFAPHFEFRFPKLGRVEPEGVGIELRQAIEPWLALGEEPGAGGTARYVDSSVERLQVKVEGLTGDRHLVTCNGRKLPLRSTGVTGEYVAGVRYRAWQPPSCLHPTIPVHAPLTFDLVDTWAGRSMGGCSYHVSHPGGRSFSTFPVNSYEAESRRVARFVPFGHSPGPITVPDEPRDPEAPLTLDLRRPIRQRGPGW